MAVPSLCKLTATTTPVIPGLACVPRERRCQAPSFRIQWLNLENGDGINKSLLVVCKTLRDNHRSYCAVNTVPGRLSQGIQGVENTRWDHWVLTAVFPVAGKVTEVGRADNGAVDWTLPCPLQSSPQLKGPATDQQQPRTAKLHTEEPCNTCECESLQLTVLCNSFSSNAPSTLTSFSPRLEIPCQLQGIILVHISC